MFIAGVAGDSLFNRWDQRSLLAYRPRYNDIPTINLLFKYWDDHDAMMHAISDGMPIMGNKGGDQNGRKYLGELCDELTEIRHRLRHDPVITDEQADSIKTFGKNWMEIHARPEDHP